MEEFQETKVPKLTDAYKVRRVNFAKKFKDIDWSRVMFSDESPFKLYLVPNSKNDVVWGSRESSVPCCLFTFVWHEFDDVTDIGAKSLNSELVI